MAPPLFLFLRPASTVATVIIVIVILLLELLHSLLVAHDSVSDLLEFRTYVFLTRPHVSLWVSTLRSKLFGLLSHSSSLSIAHSMTN